MEPKVLESGLFSKKCRLIQGIHIRIFQFALYLL